MRCCKCNNGIETGKSFIPIEAKGTPNRKWVCTECANLVQKQSAINSLGKDGMELTHCIDKDFLN